MNNQERFIIYPLLAILALAALLDLRPFQAQREPGEATFTRLSIVDKKGRERISLGITLEDPHILLFDQNENRRMELQLLDGEPGLVLFHETGLPPAVLALFKGEPRLTLLGTDKPIWQAP